MEHPIPEGDLPLVGEALLRWYDRHRRDLPWRRTRDPYRIWVSEIILQQTRVAQGTAYYRRFLERFPTVEHLARASLDEVMKVWEGLGYYSRARHMYAAAQMIVARGGRFPDTYKTLLRLPGVGPYTAAAIASIAFAEPVPVVDGNVFRVISRLFAFEASRSSPAQKEVARLSAFLMPAERPGDFNQAVMELGALLCTPSPVCDQCPLASWCGARHLGRTATIPLPAKKPSLRIRYFHYFVITFDDRLVVTRRRNKDIWHMLYELPLLETDGEEPPGKVIDRMRRNYPFLAELPVQISPPRRHQLTHLTVIARFYRVEPTKIPSLPPGWIIVKRENPGEKAFPRLIGAYLEELRSTPTRKG